MSKDISNSQDVIDSRDIIARIEELTDERDNLQFAIDEAAEVASGGEGVEPPGAVEALQAAQLALTEWSGGEEGHELKVLEALQEGAEGYAPDWRHGCTLVRESYFEDYARELVQDIGDLPKKTPSYIEIDWERTAENIRQDYTSVDFDGIEYWVR